MSFEWNHQAIKKVINLYKATTELWDPKDINYHTKNKKNDAWQQVANDMGCGVAEVRRKITSLLSSYRRERMKVKKSEGRAKIYESNWFAYPLLEFLKEKGTPTNIINRENVHDEGSQGSSQPLSDQTDETDEFRKSDTNNISSKRKIFISPKMSDKLSKKEDCGIMKAYNSVVNAPHDECTTFGEHLVTKLRKFSDQQRTVLMHAINNLIFDAEMQLYSQEK